MVGILSFTCGWQKTAVSCRWTHWTGHISGSLPIVSPESGKTYSSQILCPLSPSVKQKAIIWFVFSVRPSVHSLASYRMGFREIVCSGLLIKSVDIFTLWLNSDRNNKHLTWRSKYISIPSSIFFATRGWCLWRKIRNRRNFFFVHVTEEKRCLGERDLAPFSLKCIEGNPFLVCY